MQVVLKYVYLVWAQGAYSHTVIRNIAHIELAQEVAYRAAILHHTAHIFGAQEADSRYTVVHHSGHWRNQAHSSYDFRRN